MVRYKIVLLTLFALTIIICTKLIMEDEWYLVATLLTGLFIARDEIQELVENDS